MSMKCVWGEGMTGQAFSCTSALLNTFQAGSLLLSAQVRIHATVMWTLNVILPQLSWLHMREILPHIIRDMAEYHCLFFCAARTYIYRERDTLLNLTKFNVVISGDKRRFLMQKQNWPTILWNSAGVLILPPLFLVAWLSALSKEPQGNGSWGAPSSSKRSSNLTGQNAFRSPGQASEWQYRWKTAQKNPTTNSQALWVFLQNLVNINVDSFPAGKNNKKWLKLGFNIHLNSSVFLKYEVYKPGAGRRQRRCNFQ